MSLGPTFVKAADGYFYKDPLFFSGDAYLCFDEDDPPEVVVVKLQPDSAAEAAVRARAFLDDKGIQYHECLRDRTVSFRMFPPDWKKFRKTYSFFITVVAPIPVPDKHRGRKLLTKSSLAPGTYYEFCDSD